MKYLYQKWLYALCLTLSLLTGTVGSYAQTATTNAPSAVNPFEMGHRLPRIETDSAKAAYAEKQRRLASNPFEINRAEALPSAPILENITAIITEAPAKAVVVKANIGDQRFLFWMLLVGFLLLTTLAAIRRDFIGKIARAVLSDNNIVAFQKEPNKWVPVLLLHLLFFMVGGMLWYLVYRYYHCCMKELTLPAYLLCVGGVALVVGIKYFLVWLIGTVYPLEKEVNRYLLTLNVFYMFMGLVLLPLAVSAAFAPTELAYPLLLLSGICVAVLYGYRALRGLVIGASQGNMHKFHFFLYLCSVEIAPFLILLKTLSTMGLLPTDFL